MQQDVDFAEYVRARWARLVRMGVLLGCTNQEAEDVAQSALLKCYVSWRKVTRANSVDAYVYRTLVNCLSDSRRRRWWGERPHANVPEQEGSDPTAIVDDADAMRRALSNLARPARTVVVLRFYSRLSESEIADVLGIPRGTVKSRLSRALSQLSRDVDLADLYGRATRQ